jgi:hypothetical protein
LLALITTADTAHRDHTDIQAALANPLPQSFMRPWSRRLTAALRAAYLELRRP